MKGWQIVKHSLRQVFGNMGGALRVSLVLYLVQAVLGVALGVGAMSMGGGQMSPDQATAGFFGAVLVVAVVAIVTGLWIAVAWHRYVLLGEEGSFVPGFKGDRIWAYFLRSLGYGIILVIIALVWGLIVGFLLGGLILNNPMLGGLLMALLVYLPILVIAFRMTADLPAMALGASSEFMSGWRATEGQTFDIAVMAAILVVAAVVVEMAGAYVFDMMGPVSLVWQLVIGWVQMMVGVSVLTTLYGHYIEKRDLV